MNLVKFLQKAIWQCKYLEKNQSPKTYSWKLIFQTVTLYNIHTDIWIRILKILFAVMPMECWGITTACSTPGFPVLPDLPEFAQIHVLWVRQGCKKTILSTSSLKSPYIIPLQSASCNLGHNSASRGCNMHPSSEPPPFWVTHSIQSGLA